MSEQRPLPPMAPKPAAPVPGQRPPQITHPTPLGAPRPQTAQPAQHPAPHAPHVSAKITGVVEREEALDLEPIALDVEPTSASPGPSKIKAFGVAGMGSGKEKWTRKPNANGTGICRVRTFHGRLSDEGMGYMDDKINEWLDQHPEVEVKFVTTTIGTYEGKIREPALIVNVWY